MGKEKDDEVKGISGSHYTILPLVGEITPNGTSGGLRHWEMIKLVSFILILFLLLPSPSKQQASNSIVIWSETYRLKWSNFKNIFHKTGTGGASVVYINYEPVYFYDTLKVITIAKFDCFSSWIGKESDTSQYHLNHEQLHFDIVELFARKLRKEFANLNNKYRYIDTSVAS